MTDNKEMNQRHLLAMIETAQRAGMSEREIVGLVAHQGGGETEPGRGSLIDLGPVRRLIGRAVAKRAA